MDDQLKKIDKVLRLYEGSAKGSEHEREVAAMRALILTRVYIDSKAGRPNRLPGATPRASAAFAKASTKDKVKVVSGLCGCWLVAAAIVLACVASLGAAAGLGFRFVAGG